MSYKTLQDIVQTNKRVLRSGFCQQSQEHTIRRLRSVAEGAKVAGGLQHLQFQSYSFRPCEGLGLQATDVLGGDLVQQEVGVRHSGYLLSWSSSSSRQKAVVIQPSLGPRQDGDERLRGLPRCWDRSWCDERLVRCSGYLSPRSSSLSWPMAVVVLPARPGNKTRARLSTLELTGNIPGWQCCLKFGVICPYSPVLAPTVPRLLWHFETRFSGVKVLYYGIFTVLIRLCVKIVLGGQEKSPRSSVEPRVGESLSFSLWRDSTSLDLRPRDFAQGAS